MGEYEYPALDPVLKRLLQPAKGVEQPRLRRQVSPVRWSNSAVEHLMADEAPVNHGDVASLDRSPAMPVAYVAGHYGSPIILTDASDAQFAAFAFRSIQVFA